MPTAKHRRGLHGIHTEYLDKWPLERTEGCPCKQDPKKREISFSMGFFYTYKGTKQLQALMYLFRKTLTYKSIQSWVLPWKASSKHILRKGVYGIHVPCAMDCQCHFMSCSWLHKLPPYLLKRIYKQPWIWIIHFLRVLLQLCWTNMRPMRSSSEIVNSRASRNPKSHLCVGPVTLRICKKRSLRRVKVSRTCRFAGIPVFSGDTNYWKSAKKQHVVLECMN